MTITNTNLVFSDTNNPTKREVEARAVCTPKTVSATHIPPYAASCGASPGNFVYSSACSCYGILHSPTTLPRSTATAPTTVTVMVTPTATVQSTKTFDGGPFTAATTSQTTTIETTVTQTLTFTDTSTITVFEDATSIISSTTTTTSASPTTTTTTTTTATATATGCPIICVGGSQNGKYLYDTGSGNGNRIGWTNVASQALKWHLNTAGTLLTGQTRVFAIDYGAAYVFSPGIFQEGHNSDGEDFYVLTCTVTNSVLGCVSSHNPPRDNMFLDLGDNNLVFGTSDDSATYHWPPISLVFQC